MQPECLLRRCQLAVRVSAARRHSQDLRVLLDRVLREVDNLPEDLRAAIEKVLA